VVEKEREGTYQWLSDPTTTALAPMPKWLLDRQNTNGSKRKPRGAAIKGLRAGQSRNVNLTSIGGSLRRAGLEPEEIQAGLSAINETTKVPLPDHEVQKIADSLGNYEPSEAAVEPGGERFTDMMNAGRLANVSRNRAGYVEEMKDKWFIFRENRLVLESRSGMVPFVREVARGFFEEADRMDANAHAALTTIPDGGDLMGLNTNGLKKAKEDAHDPRLASAVDQLLRAFALRFAGERLEGMGGCYAAIELAKAEPSCRIALARLDAHPTWLNTPSGTLDLDTGTIHPHRFSDYFTKVSGALYDPVARCPQWEAFLAEVLPDPEVRAFLQRSVGYALTDLMDEQCMWFLYGKGRNGKTTLINTVRAVLGDYAASTKASTLMVKAHGDDKRNDIAVLRGARFVSATEAEDGQQMAESLIKEITGQDPLTARLMYAEFFTFQPTFKIFLAANHKPVVRGTDLAIWRRIHLVPFPQTIALDRVDAHLKQRLATEAPGILNWAIEGYRSYRETGLKPPQAVLAATKEYQDEMDPLSDFLSEMCLVDPGASCTASSLYQSYLRWTQANNVRFPLGQMRLGLQLQDKGFAQHKATGGRREWRGLRPRGE
jgi:P4 family phage/plasmid primase-like protien